jgi:hypothetical protein
MACHYQPASAYEARDAADLLAHYGRLGIGKKGRVIVRLPQPVAAPSRRKLKDRPKTVVPDVPVDPSNMKLNYLGKLRAIRAAVCAASLVSADEIMSGSRHKRVTRSRQIICYLARTRTKSSLSSIGRFLGIDHSTVVHGFQNTDWMKDEVPWRGIIRDAVAILEGTGK